MRSMGGEAVGDKARETFKARAAKQNFYDKIVGMLQGFASGTAPSQDVIIRVDSPGEDVREGP